MKKWSGEFASRVQATRAVEALKAAGVPPDAIHVWNVIPAGSPPVQGNSATRTGALAGALTGGLPGMLTGAIAGRALDSAYEEGSKMGEPQGVRVVVEHDGVDVAAILTAQGALNVK